MRNKTSVILLGVIVSLLCVYYLSLTLYTKHIEKQATEQAQAPSGDINYQRKQAYLDSIWNEPVLNVLGIELSYKELKETELSLGLDLQGGMHVTLEVSPESILEAMALDPLDSAFQAALARAKQQSQTSSTPLTQAFYNAFQQQAAPPPLTTLFAHTGTRGKISPRASDQDILDILQQEIDESIDRSFYILRARLDRFGASQPKIQKLENSQRIQIEIPGVSNPERIRKLLQGIAKLEFWEVHPPQEAIPPLQAVNDFLVKEQRQQGSSSPTLQDSLDEAFDTDLKTLLQDTDADTLHAATATDTVVADADTLNLDENLVSPLFARLRARDALVYALQDTAEIGRIFRRTDIQTLLPQNFRLLWGAKPFILDEEELLELYPIRLVRGQQAPLSGEVITDARQDFDTYARPSISMQMNARGAKAWRKMTRDNLRQRIAIVLDGRVYSAPVVESEIANGSSQISGDFSLEEAKDLANILKSGALPAPTRIVEDVVIGPTLGRQAQQQGIVSILSGLILVVLFMILYYAKGGLIADLALGFNIFFVLGILTQFNASLTLPGIAGIVLTIGMAVDANVLIFERIREEFEKGATLKNAIAQGYQKAYSSIIDANVTTFLTGAILYLLGQGPVKGFAITLMIGIGCSFFSAVFLTRLILEWRIGRRKDASFSFESVLSKRLFTQLNINFIRRRKSAYRFSLAFILLGSIAFFFKGGLPLGVDFVGGRSYVVTFPTPYSSSFIETALPPYLNNTDVEVKTFGSTKMLKVTTNYLVREDTPEADSLVRAELIRGIAAATNLKYTTAQNPDQESTFTISSSTKVGASIAQDIKNASIRSIILALVIIFLYIVIRFRRWQFGLGALVALFHDVLFVMAVITIAHLLGFSVEIDQVFIAAMLTLIGYSINDTVVIFDRVRENMGIHRGSENTKIFNLALNGTMNRTLVTSTTTLLVIIILFFFGGAILRGFSFTLLIGILVGTYSSLFIASPIVIDTLRKTIKN